MEWRVCWVPSGGIRSGVRGGLLAGWEELTACEEAVGVRAGDPIFLAPDYRVDPLLSRYVQSQDFRRHEVETKRNYATDIALLLAFLWSRTFLDAGDNAGSGGLQALASAFDRESAADRRIEVEP
ncbi:hypothetical protein ACFVFQ_37785 [Streptomyces sp. NPDC057743]|uniref:hypothetical protein n=1 Tax=Streptomyces sp. NPDC057743 TaxID=3346236 RepID=UPI0036C5B375